MDDLISRKSLIEDIYVLRQQTFMSDEVGHNRPFSDKANIIECVNNQPAAYDTDKVVKSLEHLLNNFGEHCETRSTPECTHKSCSDCVLKHAIEIVKEGVVKDE
jgi:hypothetical protein